MGDQPTAKTPGAPVPSLKDRLEQLHRDLVAQRRHAQTATTLTVVIGVLVLLVLGGYFAYGYAKIKQLADPNLLVDYAEDQLQQNLPSVRKSLEDEITRSAPKWAETLSRQALESAPTARKKLEDYTLEQYETSVKELSGMTDQQFRGYLKDNRPMLEKQFKELGSNPQLAESSLAELEASLEKQLERNMKAEAAQLLDTLHSANAKMSRLRAGDKLTKEEQIERQVMMLMRRLQSEETRQPLPAPPTTYPRSGSDGKMPSPTAKAKEPIKLKRGPQKMTPPPPPPPPETKTTVPAEKPAEKKKGE
jgi:hypothetical protein